MIKPVVETGTQSPQSTETNWCNIQKFVGTQLRNCSYRVKKSECYEVPSELSNATAPNDPTRCDRFDSDTAPTGIQPQLPPQPPSIPMQIAAPPTSTSKDCHKPMPAPWRNSRNSTRSTPLLPVMPLMRRKVQKDVPSFTPSSRSSARDRRPPQRFTDYVMYFSERSSAIAL